MKKPNISPGIWEVHGETVDQAHYVHAANKIADIAKPSGFYRAPKETDANAKAISAVPDLLEALELASEIIKTARQYFPKSVKHSDRFQLELASAAIFKALDKAGYTP